jgi:hypothetical protein
MGGRKQLAGPTAQMTVTLASFPVSDTADSSDLSVDTPASCTLTIYFVFKNQLFYISVKPSHFCTETEYSIDKSDFRFSYAS